MRAFAEVVYKIVDKFIILFFRLGDHYSLKGIHGEYVEKKHHVRVMDVYMEWSNWVRSIRLSLLFNRMNKKDKICC